MRQGTAGAVPFVGLYTPGGSGGTDSTTYITMHDICDDAQENQSDVAISETSVKAH